MDFNYSKATLLAGCLTLTLLGYSPRVWAGGENAMHAATQQTRKVTGKVTDGTESIIGATVKVKGTTNVTVTDLDGNFTLDAPQGATLEISYIGYYCCPVNIFVT